MKLTFSFLPLPFTFVCLFVWGLKFENKNIDQQLKIKRIITISTSRDFFSKISEIAKFSIWCTSKNSQIFMKKVTSWIFAQPPQALSMAQHWVIVWISNMPAKSKQIRSNGATWRFFEFWRIERRWCWRKKSKFLVSEKFLPLLVVIFMVSKNQTWFTRILYYKLGW